jgi:hypothetical protein
MTKFINDYIYVDVLSLVYRNYEVSITNLSFTVFIVIILMYIIFNKLILGHMIPRALPQIFSLFFTIKSKLVNFDEMINFLLISLIQFIN